MSKPVIAYKLLSQEMTSYNGMKWEIGKTNVATGKGNNLCTDGVLHCYSDPELAIILNPVHADITNPRLFEIECDAIVADDGTKQGSKSQTILRELPIPNISTNTKVIFAILCAKAVYTEQSFISWAMNWLNGHDRTHTAADAAAANAAAAYHAADAAAYATNAAAAYYAAAEAAEAAAYHAADANAANAAADANAAAAAYHAADAAAAANADATVAKQTGLDVKSILQEAKTYQ